jgi:hypothetical protein
MPLILPTVMAEVDPQTNAPWPLRGTLFGCYPVAVEIKGIGNIELESPAMLGPGQTLEYWLTVIDGRQCYAYRLHPRACVCELCLPHG